MHSKNSHQGCNCNCCAAATALKLSSGVTRRDFLYRIGAATVGGIAASAMPMSTFADTPAQHAPPVTLPLRVQPVLTYSLPKRREAGSWRSWGGIQTEQDVAQEKARIQKELGDLKQKTNFPIDILPLIALRDGKEAHSVANGSHDVMLIYAAGGNFLEQLTSPGKWNIMFLRHSPGPVYLWYEIVHPRFLRKAVDDYGQPGWGVEDIVVDSYSDMLMRLRALHGLKNTMHKKIIAIGGPDGWGEGGRKAPDHAREVWKMDLVNYPYKELGARIKSARQNQALVDRCAVESRRYLKQRGVSLKTTEQFVHNAFILTDVFKDVMDETKTDCLTINSCMGTIMPMSETTACLPLSILNDEGYLAFCESDFVVIPSGVLLHYISGLPVFLNDPTYPHGNVVTLAHCTAPRKMDGKRFEPAKILTHFESDYGAAPKVEMKVGQVCTNLVPDFASRNWVGFAGTIVGNPFLDICRSQVEMRIDGDETALLQEMKGFHWMMSYGNYLRECAYALKKVGINFHDVSASTRA